jgi:hypothetical protein
MKKLALAGSAILFAACSESSIPTTPDVAPVSAVATAPGLNKLQCQAEAPATCTKDGNGAKGTATLDTREGGYALVYLNNLGNLGGLDLADVQQLSFRYTGDATPGAPRISLAIDTNGDGATDTFAFIAAYYCNDGAGLVDVINDPTCTIFVGEEEFENWAALVAAHPDWQVAVPNTSGEGTDYSFIIADEPGLWTISDVTLGKPGAQK